MPSAPIAGTVLWPDPEAGPWAVTVHWRVQHGVPTPVGFQMRSWREEGVRESRRLPMPDTAGALPRFEGQLLRGLSITDLLRDTRAAAVTSLDARAVLLEAASHFAADDPSQKADKGRAQRTREAAEVLHGERPRGGRYLGDEHYREVAQVYAQALAEGRRPTKAVGEHFRVEPSSAAKKVSRARELGLLPKTTRGRAGVLKEQP